MCKPDGLILVRHLRGTNMPLPTIRISDAVQKAAYDDLAHGSMEEVR